MAAKLAPIFNDAQLNNNGVPLSGGLLTWYQANSSTVAITYTDSAGTIPQSNPIILNARGEPESPIWLQTGSNYKAILSDATGVTIRIVDNLSGVNDTSAPIISEWVLFTGSATYIGATSFSVAGDQTTYFTAARRIKASVSGGVCYATITTAVYASSKTTVTVVNDSVTLDSGIGSVYYGFMDPTHPSFNTAVSSYASTAGSAAACTGNSVTATTAAACSGNSATATTLSGNQANWATLRTTAVSNMLGWTSFGNGHVIIDASSGFDPSGAIINNVDPLSGHVWQASYPTLMGWNGSSTYGVRVDSARTAGTCTGNATTATTATTAAACSGNSTTATTATTAGSATNAGQATNASNVNGASTLTGNTLNLGVAGVNGDARVYFSANGNNDSVIYQKVSDSSLNIRNDVSGAIKVGNASVGVILGSGLNSWSAYSDERLKDIIEPIENAIEKIITLNPVIGKYKTDEVDIRRSFLIAQDVVKVFPEAISYSKIYDENDITDNIDYMNLSYTDLIPLLIASVKELTGRIAALEAI